MPRGTKAREHHAPGLGHRIFGVTAIGRGVPMAPARSGRRSASVVPASATWPRATGRHGPRAELRRCVPCAKAARIWRNGSGREHRRQCFAGAPLHLAGHDCTSSRVSPFRVRRGGSRSWIKSILVLVQEEPCLVRGYDRLAPCEHGACRRSYGCRGRARASDSTRCWAAFSLAPEVSRDLNENRLKLAKELGARNVQSRGCEALAGLREHTGAAFPTLRNGGLGAREGFFQTVPTPRGIRSRTLVEPRAQVGLQHVNLSRRAHSQRSYTGRLSRCATFRV